MEKYISGWHHAYLICMLKIYPVNSLDASQAYLDFVANFLTFITDLMLVCILND